MRKFAITDIHGCHKTFVALLDKIAFSTSDELYLLGDYVDRGPDSKGVLDEIFRLQKNGYKVHCLRGNHEEILLRSLYDPMGLENWLLTDGKKTMDSFGVEATGDIPGTYLNFMRELDYFLEVDEYILVHAGLNFNLFDPLEDKRDLLIIRRWYDAVRYDWLGPRIVLHGHTPVPYFEIEKQLEQLDRNRYMDLDAGCVYAGSDRPERSGWGLLCAFEMTGRRLVFQENVE